MKAALIRKYGGPEVLEIAEVPRPSPKANEVLIAVHASSVNPVDWLIRDGSARSFVRNKLPTILGCDLAGTVAEVGSAVTQLSVGDAVFAMMPQDWGAHAEFVALPETLVVKKPSSLSMEEATGLCTASLTALGGLVTRAKTQAGDRVLINGGSSSVGMAAVQIAKALGAHVTAVCSGANFPLVKGLGADALIDYKTTDFTAGTERYDLVFDCVGTQPYPRCLRVLKGKRIHATTVPGVRTFLRQALNPLLGAKVFALLTTGNGAQLTYVKSLVESGKLKTVIDRVLPLDQIAAAHEYSKTGRAKGKIILKLVA